ncbi:helix-turn-helix domain-containing protein [Streptomyces sp. 891-h]|uniref:ArsR/SmtB family transcription factor n=1 Tax=Streptomyces sp. 891-h TaxID=2720714 RepID=UPI001FAAC3CF|nr:helix-turn-helix domain-containing protein [Streptomyces sp. 891-h]UNZ21159.1 helix-turn-helix transcriptional regulator [Streptomyces sp. 891-h]
MIELEFTPADYLRIHFAFSPVAEVVTSLRTFSLGRRSGIHGPWFRSVDSRLDGVDMELLTALVRPIGYVPDFLNPHPRGRTGDLDAGLEQIARTDPAIISAELAHLAGHRTAQQGPGHQRRAALMRELLADTSRAIERITTELAAYSQVALAPHWPRIHALLQADLAHRLEELASAGAARLFATLHPSVAMRGEKLAIVKYYDGRAQLRGRGLLLTPCVFAWPDVLVRTADPQPRLTYSPRGLGPMWESAPDVKSSPLAAVVGKTKAAILATLELPMSTTQLAAQLALTAPTLNAHLKTLQAAAILTSRRDGRSVLYQRTRLGDQLVHGQDSGVP